MNLNLFFSGIDQFYHANDNNISTGSYLTIGIGRFRILRGGGQGLEYWGGGKGGGANSQLAHDVVTTSHRCHFYIMCPLGF